jgi:hypothetical protein
MKFHFCAIAIAGILLSSCVEAPKETAFKNGETYNISKDEAWSRLLAFFTSQNIQVKTIEKDSGVIYAERSSADPTLADCGKGGLAADVNRTGTVNVFVLEKGPQQTQVTVNTDFSIMRQFDGQPIVGQCKSKGILERMILDSIRNPAA